MIIVKELSQLESDGNAVCLYCLHRFQKDADDNECLNCGSRNILLLTAVVCSKCGKLLGECIYFRENYTGDYSQVCRSCALDYLAQEPIFPQENFWSGMTILDYFAAQAMQSLIRYIGNYEDVSDNPEKLLSQKAYQIAKAMLWQKNKEKGGSE